MFMSLRLLLKIRQITEGGPTITENGSEHPVPRVYQTRSRSGHLPSPPNRLDPSITFGYWIGNELTCAHINNARASEQSALLGWHCNGKKQLGGRKSEAKQKWQVRKIASYSASKYHFSIFVENSSMA